MLCNVHVMKINVLEQLGHCPHMFDIVRKVKEIPTFLKLNVSNMNASSWGVLSGVHGLSGGFCAFSIIQDSVVRRVLTGEELSGDLSEVFIMGEGGLSVIFVWRWCPRVVWRGGFVLGNVLSTGGFAAGGY